MLGKIFANRSYREKLFLVAALLCGVSMGYFLLRFKPRGTQIDAAIREAQRTLTQVSKVRAPGELPQSPDQLRKKLAWVKKELDSQRSRLAACRQFASLDNTGAVQKLNVQLSELAQTTGVRIRERGPYKASRRFQDDRHDRTVATSISTALASGGDEMRVTDPFLDQTMVYEICGESLQRFVVEASFASLRQYLDGLNGLPWPVAVVDFEISTVTVEDAGLHRQSLSATLILAL